MPFVDIGGVDGLLHVLSVGPAWKSSRCADQPKTKVDAVADFSA
jgi:hypothetical protein